MPLTDYLDEYEFADDDPTFDLNAIPADEFYTDRFREEFPDGVVPIRAPLFMPSAAGENNDPLTYLDTVLRVRATCERILGCVPTDAMEAAREALINLRPEYQVTATPNEASCEVTQRRRELLGELLQGGLTLRMAARYLRWSVREVVACAGFKPEDGRVDAVLALDEHMHRDEAELYVELAERYGIGRKAVVALAKLRGHQPRRQRYSDEQLDEAVRLRLGRGWSPAATLDHLAKRFPSEPPIPYNTICHMKRGALGGRYDRRLSRASGAA